jgi:hypothetical protein
MSIVTLVAFILCPVAWFVIKLIGIKAEAQLNEQKEAVIAHINFPSFLITPVCAPTHTRYALSARLPYERNRREPSYHFLEKFGV